MIDTLTLRTTVHTKTLNETLYQGMLLASLGIIGIVLAGALLPPAILTKWGLPIFFTGLVLITYGLLPYRKLKRLQANPDKLILSSDETLSYLKKDKPVLTIPLESVETVIYREDLPGIEIQLKFPLPKPVILHQKGAQRDLFFPYFGRKAFDEIKQHLSD